MIIVKNFYIFAIKTHSSNPSLCIPFETGASWKVSVAIHQYLREVSW